MMCEYCKTDFFQNQILENLIELIHWQFYVVRKIITEIDSFIKQYAHIPHFTIYIYIALPSSLNEETWASIAMQRTQLSRSIIMLNMLIVTMV